MTLYDTLYVQQVFKGVTMQFEKYVEYLININNIDIAFHVLFISIDIILLCISIVLFSQSCK